MKSDYCVQQHQMEPELLAYLTQEDWLDKTDQQLLQEGFYKVSDNPYLENHHYMERYFHGCKENLSIPSGSQPQAKGWPVDGQATSSELSSRQLGRRIKSC